MPEARELSLPEKRRTSDSNLRSGVRSGARLGDDGVPLAARSSGSRIGTVAHYAKGPKRRPVRVEFCEGAPAGHPGVLRRLASRRRPASQGTREGGRQDRESLPAHMERVTTRLTACRGGRRFPAALDALIEAITRELDRERARAKTREAKMVRSWLPVWPNSIG